MSKPLIVIIFYLYAMGWIEGIAYMKQRIEDFPAAHYVNQPDIHNPCPGGYKALFIIPPATARCERE